MKFAGLEKCGGSGGKGDEADASGGMLNGGGVTINATGKDIDLDATASKLASQLADVDVHAASVAGTPKWGEGRGRRRLIIATRNFCEAANSPDA